MQTKTYLTQLPKIGKVSGCKQDDKNNGGILAPTQHNSDYAFVCVIAYILDIMSAFNENGKPARGLADLDENEEGIEEEQVHAREQQYAYRNEGGQENSSDEESDDNENNNGNTTAVTVSSSATAVNVNTFTVPNVGGVILPEGGERGASEDKTREQDDEEKEMPRYITLGNDDDDEDFDDFQEAEVGTEAVSESRLTQPQYIVANQQNQDQELEEEEQQEDILPPLPPVPPALRITPLSQSKIDSIKLAMSGMNIKPRPGVENMVAKLAGMRLGDETTGTGAGAGAGK